MSALEKIIECLNNGEMQINVENFSFHLSEDDKRIIFFINRITEKYHCFSPEEIPYSYYNEENWQVLQPDLLYIASNIENSLVSYKIFDFIWLKCKDIDSARKAFGGFVEIICTENNYERNFYLFNRCVNIYESIKQTDLDFEFNKALYSIIEQGKDDDSAYSLNVLKLAYDKKYLPLNQLVVLMKEKLNQYQENLKFHFLIDLSLVLEKVYFEKEGKNQLDKPCNIKEISYLRRQRADIYLKDVADTKQHPMSRIDNLKKALKELKGLHATDDERRNLHSKLSELRALLNESMHLYSKSFDISEAINYYSETAKKLEDSELFYFFIFCTELFDYQSGQDSLMKIEGNMLSKHLLNNVILYKNGAVKAIMPSWTDALKSGAKKDMLPHVEKHCTEMYGYNVNAGMTHILNLVKERKYDLSSEITELVENSLFVPEKRKKIFEKALTLGLDLDFISAISILAPQIESSLRELAIMCGDAVTKINSDTTEEVLSLEQLLQLPMLNECIDEKLLFNIKLLFSSEFGFNIRNEIAHGLYDDEDFKKVQSFFAWWFTLRVCAEFSQLKNRKIKCINSKLKN